VTNAHRAGEHWMDTMGVQYIRLLLLLLLLLLLSLFVHEVQKRTDNTKIDGTVQQILKIKGE